MDNPITYALKHSNTKPIDLSRELRLSRQYISRAELGMHVNLNLRLTHWTVNQLRNNFGEEFSMEDAFRWYEGFKSNKRMLNVVKLGICEPYIDSYDFKRPEVPLVITLMGIAPPARLDFIPLQGKVRTASPVARKSNSETIKDNFLEWRKKYWSSTYSFASDMCLPPSTVDMYEHGRVNKMPREIREFFKWVNYG